MDNKYIAYFGRGRPKGAKDKRQRRRAAPVKVDTLKNFDRTTRVYSLGLRTVTAATRVSAEGRRLTHFLGRVPRLTSVDKARNILANTSKSAGHVKGILKFFD